jgi:hypothetical protein
MVISVSVRIHLFCLWCALLLSAGITAKERKENASPAESSNIAPRYDGAGEFHWSDHNRLSWDDFKGAVSAAGSESAAATHCGIGFTVDLAAKSGAAINVYNTFYTNRSWVRPDAKLQEVLDHEQGHFDLCEIYTRKLRQRMSMLNLHSHNLRLAMQHVYTDLKQEYESEQAVYELETVHGTNVSAQRKWQDMIAVALQ